MEELEASSASPLGPEVTPGVRRSSRKQKSTSDPFDSRRSRMSTSSLPGPSSGNAGNSTTDSAVLDQLKEMMKEVREVREDVNRAEVGTAARIDSLSKKMTDRLNKAELGVKCLSKDVAAVKSDIVRVRKTAAEESVRLEKLIGETVEKKLGTRPDLGRRPRTSRTLTGANLIPLDGPNRREDDYMSARKSLKIWPVVGPDLADAAIAFMVTRLTMKPGRIDPATLKVTELQTGPDSSIKSQVLVEFPSVRLRDEVKALARNLKGSADAGIQMEVPDFLRGRFQTFQSLAFEMKKKNPALRRNIKFLDAEMELVMDVKLNAESDWKTVQYEDASAILPTTRGRTQSISRTELAGLIVCEKSDDASDIADDTLVDLTEDENITDKNYSRHSLSFINTNARSLGPKLSLCWIACTRNLVIWLWLLRLGTRIIGQELKNNTQLGFPLARS